MVVSCWVNGCTNRRDGSAKLSYFNIPKIRLNEGDQTQKISEERRRVWLANINRKDEPSQHSKICSNHFVTGNPAALYDRANPDWAPTLKLTGNLSSKKSDKKIQESTTSVKRCCVPRCKGNYPTGPKVAVFSFPRDEALSLQWVRAIKRDNFTPNQNSKVCELHFVPKDIERDTSYFDERIGTTLTVNLKIPRLRKEAVPSQLPNCSTYLSRTPLLREIPEERKCRKEQDAIKTAIAESVEDEVPQLYYKSEYSEQWMELREDTSVLSCMTQYNELRRAQLSSKSPTNTSSFPFKTSDTTSNLALNPVEEDVDDDDDDGYGEYEDPVALLTTGKTSQLMKLLQKYRRKNIIPSSSEEHQSFTLKREQEPVIDALENVTHITDHPTASEENKRLLLHDSLAIKIQDTIYASVLKNDQEHALAQYILTESTNIKYPKNEDICKMVFNFCVFCNIVRPAMWNINRTADMEWLKGFFRRYPVVKWNTYHNKKNVSEGKDSPEKEIKSLNT